MVSWYERDFGMDQYISEGFGSAVPAQQFLLVDEICHRVSSKHFPVEVVWEEKYICVKVRQKRTDPPDVEELAIGDAVFALIGNFAKFLLVLKLFLYILNMVFIVNVAFFFRKKHMPPAPHNVPHEVLLWHLVLVKFNQIWQDSVIYSEILWDSVRYGEIWCGSMRYGEIL